MTGPLTQSDKFKDAHDKWLNPPDDEFPPDQEADGIVNQDISERMFDDK